MRMTITLSEEAYRTTKVYSVQKKISMSKAMNQLLTSNEAPSSKFSINGERGFYIDPKTKLPVSQSRRKITLEDIKRSRANRPF